MEGQGGVLTPQKLRWQDLEFPEKKEMKMAEFRFEKLGGGG